MHIYADDFTTMLPICIEIDGSSALMPSYPLDPSFLFHTMALSVSCWIFGLILLLFPHNIIMTFEDFQYNFSAQPRSHQVNILVRGQTTNNWLVRLDADSFGGHFVVGVALLLTRVEFILSTVKKIISVCLDMLSKHGGKYKRSFHHRKNPC